MGPLSSQRYQKVIARYGRVVTITQQREVSTAKPWQRAVSDEAVKAISADAVIQAPRIVQDQPAGGAMTAYQEREALIQVAGLSVDALLAASLFDGAERFHIVQATMLDKTGTNHIYRAQLAVHKGVSL